VSVRRSPAAHRSNAAHARVRIVGGVWKRSLLPVPDLPGLRPTPDRVRETLFNWLGQDLSGWRCLDLFAGSGALGFEAASRGAERVLMIERDPVAIDALQQTRQRLGATQVEIVRGDAFAWLARPFESETFDLVFVDPPFNRRLAEEALPALVPWLAAGASVYVESGSPVVAPVQFEQIRADKAGRVHYHLMQIRNGA